MEEIVEVGGYFKAVEGGIFVDSGMYPERNGDGIARKADGGIGFGYVYERDEDYFAPVTAHFGYNNVAQYSGNPDNPSELIGGCTFEDPDKIVYIDELDEVDNVKVRMEETAKYRNTNLIKPEMEWMADGTVMMNMFIPATRRVAEVVAGPFKLCPLAFDGGLECDSPTTHKTPPFTFCIRNKWSIPHLASSSRSGILFPDSGML